MYCLDHDNQSIEARAIKLINDIENLNEIGKKYNKSWAQVILNYQTKGNIIMGVIFSILLLTFGSFYLIGLKQYQTDTDYLYNIGELIKVDFPAPTKVITQNWMQGK